MNKYNDFSNIVTEDLDESGIIDAFKMSLCEYSKNDIMRILSETNDEIKIMPIISLKSIDNENEFNLLIEHLVGKDGRIREAVSFVLSEIEGCGKYLKSKKSKETVVKSLLDINPNAVRNVISFIEKNKNIKNELAPYIIKETRKTLKELDKFLKKDTKFHENKEKSFKNHAKNKLTFNLYWLLSSISILDLTFENLEDILTKCSCFLDYTIREKTALIISKMKDVPNELLQKLKQDENIYVKNQLL